MSIELSMVEVRKLHRSIYSVQLVCLAVVAVCVCVLGSLRLFEGGIEIWQILNKDGHRKAGR